MPVHIAWKSRRKKTGCPFFRTAHFSLLNNVQLFSVLGGHCFIRPITGVALWTTDHWKMLLLWRAIHCSCLFFACPTNFLLVRWRCTFWWFFAGVTSRLQTTNRNMEMCQVPPCHELATKLQANGISIVFSLVSLSLSLHATFHSNFFRL